MSRRVLVGVAGAVVLVASVVVALLVGGGGSDGEATPTTSPAPIESPTDPAVLAARVGLGDPAEVEVPRPVDDHTRSWLADQGAPAVAMVRVSEALWVDGADACPSVADGLDAAATPEDARVAAAGTPHEPTRELLVSLHALVVSALRSCGDPEMFEQATGELAWQWTVTDRHLREIGVR